MDFPEELYCKNRKKIQSSEILDKHYQYARHKPGHDWNERHELPDYTKIKIDPNNKNNQSFNWDQFSEPHWVRFDPQGKYLIDYAVVGFLTGTIRNVDQFDNNIENGLIDVEHKPIENNYSHCQLYCTEKFKNIETNKKTIRRAIRMAMRHNSHVFLKPFES